MPGLTPQLHLEILLDHLAEAERKYAAGVPYPDKAGGNWPDSYGMRVHRTCRFLS